MKNQKLAEIISVILGPQVWLPILLTTTLLRSGLATNQLYILFPTLFILQVIIPIAYLYLAVHFKITTAWDLPKKEERYLFLTITSICYSISLVLTYIFGNQFTFQINLIFLLLLIIIFAITLNWKISHHTSLNTAGVILLNLLFDWKLPFLYLLIPLVFWARLTLNRHTIIQLVAGILLSTTLLLAAFKYLDYF